MGEFFDCKRASEYYLDAVRSNLKKLRTTPFVKILSGIESDATEQYKHFLMKRFSESGMRAECESSLSSIDLEKKIASANHSDEVTGMLVLFPTKFNVPDDYFMSLIDEHKDIEGISWPNIGRLQHYVKFFDKNEQYKAVVPCTAKAVVKLLEYNGLLRQPTQEGAFGENFTIINNSPRIGRPLEQMLQNLRQTTTLCHQYSKKDIIQSAIRNADVIITAVPSKVEIVTPDMIRQGAILVDCSYEGNYDPDRMKERANNLIGEKNRIGSLTTTMAMLNTTYLAGFQQNIPTTDF